MSVEPRFLTAEGPQIFTGSELLLKGALEVEGGVHLLGGYPGSPIAGFFDSMSLIRDLLIEKGIRAVINNNEALAAAMLNGSQVAGCRGVICMKSVGVHVAADALSLGSLAGAHPNGGAVVIYGDDPWSDSTQVPADSRFISRHLFIPVIEPANPQEVKDFIDLALKLSRRSELYSGYIMPTNLADGGGTVMCRPNQFPRENTRTPRDFQSAGIDLNKHVLLPPKTWWQEAKYAERFEKAIAVARELGMNRIDYPAEKKKPIGLATGGLAHGYLVQTLWELGLLGEFPILKFGMSYPVDAQLVRQLARQCERIIVVEERRSFLEEQINDVVLKDRQHGGPAAGTEVWGKKFPNDLEGFPEIRGLHPSIIIERLVPLLKWIGASGSHFVMPAEALDRELATADATGQAELGTLPARLPSFCAGCPHRDSSSLCLEIKRGFMDADYMLRKHKRGPVDLVFHGDIGCYTMLMYPPNTPLMHNLSGMGLGGGTGSGMDPFITNKQAVFMGDSTFFHSGLTAISQAVKLGQDITFIILDNRTTAMTGHQPTPASEYDVIGNPTAVQDIQDVVRGIAGRGNLSVVRVDPEKRKDYRELLEKTFLADGVKVIIADKECGITKVRRGKRSDRAVQRRLGYLPKWEHMNVNQEICRLCLACTELTGCPGLKHVETDYGRKIDTDLTWCVNDGACERIGACSAFERVVIKRRRPPRLRMPELDLENIPEPSKRPAGDVWRCCLAGVGTQGVGTATQILVRAAHNEGYEVSYLDKKGLAIRGGGVNSQVVYNIAKQPITAVVPYGKADLLIGIDILEAARTIDPQGRLRCASPKKTAAVINTDKFATILGTMGREDFDTAELERALRRHTRSDDYLARNISRICEKYLGNKIYANIMMLGFAFQKGLIPVSMHSMAWAIKNTIRTDFRKNLIAFNMGRKLVVQQDLFQGPPRRTAWRDVLEDKCRWAIRRFGRAKSQVAELRRLASETAGAVEALEEPLKRDIVIRLYDCMRWGGAGYASRYANGVRSIYAKDSSARNYAATRAVIYNLAKAMLINDGIFTAELATNPGKLARDRDKYNVNRANGDKIHYRHMLHWKWRIGGRRLELGLTVTPWQLKLLKRMRWLRRLFAAWHRDEREFLKRYEALIADFAHATDAEYDRRLEALASPQCMSCMNPICSDEGCPLESPIPRWIELAHRGKWQQAGGALHEKNNFPELTAILCPAPCQGACKQGLQDYPVRIKLIEKQIVDHALGDGSLAPAAPAEKTHEHVAIIGSGPAGLAAAQQLARAGHDVTIFEKDDTPGGLLRYGIPDWRLEKNLIDRRLAQLQAEGITFETGAEIGRDVAADELKSRFDAVVLATGAARPRDLPIPGREKTGVHFAMDFLRCGNARAAGEAEVPTTAGPEISAANKAVVVIGGGDTGNDCVEMALAQGARRVHQLEILPQSQVNGRPNPPGLGNVDRKWCVATKAFGGNGERLSELSAMEVRWVKSWRGPQMVEVPGSEFTIPADLAILALGYDAVVDPELAAQLDVKAEPDGRLVVNDFATSAAGVFAAGDLVTGASTVASAIATGRKAAKRINQYLARA
ncbi:MAG: FAD-dependent oxidoreductase [Planctomycetota bacterium]|jgi:indolepyruvate ferredoxin oxidoreductase